MEHCDLVIVVFACDTVEKYKRQIETINSTWGKNARHIKMSKFYIF